MVPFHGQNFVHFRGQVGFLDRGVLEEFGAIRLYSLFVGAGIWRDLGHGNLLLNLFIKG